MRRSGGGSIAGHRGSPWTRNPKWRGGDVQVAADFCIGGYPDNNVEFDLIPVRCHPDAQRKDLRLRLGIHPIQGTRVIRGLKIVPLAAQVLPCRVPRLNERDLFLSPPPF
jgi:hypothetical protein